MKALLAIGAAGALSLTLAACGASSGAGTHGLVDGKTFTMALSGDPGSLDPHFTSLAVTDQVDDFLYDSLVDVDAKGAVIARLADKWDGGATHATFTLRKGITCADGSPLTATQVAANITFVGDAKNASSRTGVFVQPGTTATGDDASGLVTVESPSPDAFLLRNVGSLDIVCASGMQNRQLLRQGAAGTGMFAVTDVVAGDHYTLSRRKDYSWGPGAFTSDQRGLPDVVVFKIISNETTAVNLLAAHSLNAASLSGPEVQRAQGLGLRKSDAVAPFGELWFNHKAGLPGADEAVRRALVQALDLAQLGKVLTSGHGKPSTGLIPAGIGPCPGDTVGATLPAHDPGAAKSALDAAGWSPGAGGVRVKDGRKLSLALDYRTSGDAAQQAGAELVQQIWGGLGAEVTLKAVADAEIGQSIVGGEGSWDVAIIPMLITLPSTAVPFLSGPGAPAGTNFSGIANAEYLAGVRAAAAQPGTAGCAQWNAAETALYRHVDLVPFVDTNSPVFLQDASLEISELVVRPSSIRMLG